MLLNEAIEKITETIDDAEKLYGERWDSALVGGDSYHHAITSEQTQDVVARAADDSLNSSWLCDYLEAVSPGNVRLLLARIKELEQREMACSSFHAAGCEPVAWRWRWSDDAEGCWRYTEEQRETRGSVTAQPLYAAPPAPVIPEGWEPCSPEWIDRNGPCSCGESPRIAFGTTGTHYHPHIWHKPAPVAVPDDIPESVYEILCQACGGKAWKYADELWNACRAAMLKAGPVTGWIKCSERMPEEGGRYWCYVEEQNSLGKSHYQWNCSWNGNEWSGKALTGCVTHWMPLPAAPEQEV